ncbi:FAD/NAD(P)-dependent oxidoreductase [Streptomyces beijiangensis]|uniref:FAD-dependent oxidoreductase n=1 Tax=Streptomyces beijiangensis TaxID=163361 RepID=A0A939FC83_9ACTN|nr:NAD(P)/FAD-dependent oxidoreductase [Streptomyces beijiangensis]MBO0515947.1 FAD-dependent oxidoreductase [Streptomyces beijiangensis]
MGGTEQHTLVVIGAGPAGIAAALAAADAGVRVTIVDSAPQAGGQFYRRPAAGLGARRPQALHHAWGTWESLNARLQAHIAADRIRHLTDHHVWFVERLETAFTVHALVGPEQTDPDTVTADAVVLATGGYEKVLPFPGWTLPGVVTAGGAQAMLKGGLVLPGRTVVVAGTGPLLMPVAAGLAAAGATIAAYIESADPKSLVRHASTLARNPAKLAEGAQYGAALARHGVPVRMRHTVVRAHGTARLEAVTVAALDAEGRIRPGTGRRIACDTLAVGHGMLPHTDLAETLGCALDGVRVAVDAEQRTDVPGIWAAGEATGIGGAVLSLAEGEIAGHSVAAQLQGTDPDPRGWSAAAKTRSRLRAFFAAIDTVYAPPAHWPESVTDETVLCRCEEVTAGEIREAVEGLGAGDLRTVKLLTRAGMGWCQGRICAPGVAGVAGCPADTARRPFARPVPLGVLAGPADTEPNRHH